MSNERENALMQADFGSRVAEDEVDRLHEYFVETEQWRKLIAGDVDIVFGAKGAGKSALYSLLVSQKDVLRLGRRTVFVAAENPRGTPAFRDIVPNPPASEEEFRGLWKLYFLSLVANYLRYNFQVTKTSNAKATTVFSALVENGLLVPDINLLGRLKAILEYLRKYAPVFEGAVIEPNTGIKLTGKITLDHPSSEQRESAFVSVDHLLGLIDEALKECNIKVWLLLDRLDVAFSDSPVLEGAALRSLFRTYLDMLNLSNISVKIFLRDDIWSKIVASGFREASHVTRTMVISWDSQSLLNLIVRRVVHNDSICSLYGVSKEAVLQNAMLQSQFFYRAFPAQIDIGQKQPSTFDWMSSRTADGSKRTAPRELIHLLKEMRDEQLKLYELGNSDPPVENLFSRLAITQALPAVSKARYEQTLCAENPGLKPFLDGLDREKTQQTPESLSKLWKCSSEKALDMAEQLAEVGFFERRGPKDNSTYWVPFLYRDALRLVQGSA
ncbi:MAG: P-loop ATPase, Sll1717 family [Gammaproteobacteria bacterium]